MAFFESNFGDRDSLLTLKRWLENKNRNKTFVDYFRECNYKQIAICDAGDIGMLLFEEIKNSEIKVKYFVDINWEGLKTIAGIPVISLSDVGSMDEVDVVVVCPPESYGDVGQYLVQHLPKIRTLYLKDAVYEI